MATFPQQVLDDMIRGGSYYRELKNESIVLLMNGCDDCSVKSYDCLGNILMALNDKNSLDEYDDIAIKLYDEMMIIIGDSSISEQLIGYWWLSDEGAPALTESEILTKTQFLFNSGGGMRVPFVGVVYKQLNIAYPNTQATRTKYANENNPDDFGDIGGISNLLGSVIPTGIFKQHLGNYVVNGNRNLIFTA